MNQLYRHLPLNALLLGVTLGLCACSQAAAPSLSPAEAYEQAEAGTITLVDIRTPMEWRQTGIATPALRIDMHHPQGPDGFAAQLLAEVDGDKTAPVALICRTGNRSGQLQRELMARGFTKLYDVKEGMAGSSAGPGWIRRGLPITPCPDC